MPCFEIWSLYAVIALTICLGWYKINKDYFRWFTQSKKKVSSSSQVSREKSNDEPVRDPYHEIEPLSSFDWKTATPIKFRPFKPKFHLTMALENGSISDLIAVDKTYLHRIHLRRSLLDTLGTEIVDANPLVTSAVREFYDWTFGTYLPTRFSTMFRLSSTPEKLSVTNLVTNEFIPLPAPPDPIVCLRTLGAHIDDDFLFLLPDHETGKYTLRGYIACFPSGFDTRTKMNLPLAAIHTPVPSYGSKLEKSMDRFFATVPSGKVVKRANWTITTDRNLHKSSGSHFSEKEDLDEAKMNVDLNNTVLRTERQTLHRLWGSKALVFAFKTYQYELRDVKAEGSGEALAEAIEGLGKGSVPEMMSYKRGKVWGEKVCKFLRDEKVAM